VASTGNHFWTGKPVLVTGAGGFIGSHVVDHLVREGAEVRAFVRYNSRNDHGRLEDCDPGVQAAIEVFLGDLVNPEAVRRAVAGTEVVLHLGALIPIPYSYVHPREYVEANVVGTLNVLEASRAEPAVERVVQISSSEVYGTAQTVPISEEHPLRPQSPYAATKVGADQLALTYWRSFETPVVVARPFNTFGPRQSARAIIPTIISQALSRDVIELGALTPTRDLLYVGDTAAGIVRCAEVPGVEGETLNLGTGLEISVADLADRLVEMTGFQGTIVSTEERLRPPDSEVERLVADASRARRLLGWEPEVDLTTGLERTVEWVRRRLDLYKPAVYNV
jgi:NAD dependent epimerase/dehydratase